jgi:GTP cyclohydrolase II
MGKLNMKVNALLRGKNEEAVDDFEVHLHLSDPCGDLLKPNKCRHLSEKSE